MSGMMSGHGRPRGGLEVASLEARINELGSEGWEMISYESVPMFRLFQ
jgi:hypothetical protein